jgi:hypothetical protein
MIFFVDFMNKDKKVKKFKKATLTMFYPLAQLCTKISTGVTAIKHY